MELIVKHLQVYDRSVIGCKKHNSDVMISFSQEKIEKESHDPIHDIFLSKDQAYTLIEKLKSVCDYNLIDDVSRKD